MKTTIIVKNVKEIIKDNLMDCVGEYVADLHFRLFNESPFYIYTNDAKKALNQIDVFKAIDIVQNYEKHNFGYVYTKIEPCAIANMLIYIAGYTLLGNSQTLNDKWDEKLTKSDLLKIRKELNAFMRENPHNDLLSDW